MTDSGEQPVKIRILVLDEQPLLRQGISVYLNSQPDMVVCGEADSIPGAWSRIAQCQPQLVVTELRLGCCDSRKLVKELKGKNRALSILVYSAFEETIFAERAMRAGANGYVMKQAPREKLASAIRDVVNGGIYVSREVALGAYRKSLQRRRRNNRALRSATCLESLSDREMHIFQLLGSGMGTRQIAQSLGLSVKTIDAHRDNIKHKLHLSSSGELSERAAKWVERSFNAEEHLFRGTRLRKRSTAMVGRALPCAPVRARNRRAGDCQPYQGPEETPRSQVGPETAASASQPASTSRASYAITE
jgi:DNA-binding NarL/FixJ family response regulator